MTSRERSSSAMARALEAERRSAAPRAIHRRTLLAGAGSLITAPAVVRAQAQAAGVALVIGNSKYAWEASLPNVRRDAPDIAKRFQALGLRTELIQDAGRDSILKAVEALGAAARGVPLSAFYFAGHGVQDGRTVYLVPVDADLSDPRSVARLVPVPTVRLAMEAAPNRLMVLDNCRNNPADGWRQRDVAENAGGSNVRQGAVLNFQPNTLQLFSTAPGRIALDGPAGENSPFAAALLRHLEAPSIDIRALPALLRRDLLIATEGRQVVWDLNTFKDPYVIAAPAGRPAGTAPRAPGWANDPSRIVELTNAYAFAQQQQLPIPRGLVAHRAPSNSRDSRKVGAFRYETGGGAQGASLLVVMSVEEAQSAELIATTRSNGRPSWRFVHGAIAGDAIEFDMMEPAVRYHFKWSDANSGSVSIQFPRAGGNTPAIFNGRFSRLD